MIGRKEIRASLDGAWQLFLNRRGAMRLFDVTVDGFWRSFQAIVLVAPGYALTVIAEEQRVLSDSVVEENFSQSVYFLDKVVALGIDWVAFPILLALVARPLGIAGVYPGYIVARNWAAVIATVPFGAIALLTIFGVLGNDTGAILSFAAIAVVLRYNFIVARAALGASIGFAVAVVVCDFATSLIVATAIDGLFDVAATAQ
jgi:hypothetical protein